MCFAPDALPPRIPEDRVIPALAGGAAAERLTLESADGTPFIAALAECPVGRWVCTDELFRYMRAAGHEFEVTRDSWSLYICDPQYGSLGYDGYGDWHILQARYAL